MYIDKDVTEKTLHELGLIEVPPPENEEQIWVYGLCLVEKSNGRAEYVVVRHDFDEDKEIMTVIRDYGSVCAIKTMGTVLPYEYVTQRLDIPIKTGADIANFLAKRQEVDVETFKGLSKAKLMAKFKKELITEHIKMNKFSNGK